MFFKSHSGGFSAKQLETSPWGLQATPVASHRDNTVVCNATSNEQMIVCLPGLK